MRRTASSTTLDRLLYADIKTYLVELLMKQDQMSMAASIESRVPFLDHQLVEFAAALPPRLKLRGFTTKWILREAVRVDPAGRDPVAAEDGLPGAVRPLDARRRGTTSRATSCSTRARASAASSMPAAVERLLAAHRSGAAEGADAIWSLLNLELWYRTFIDGDGVQTLPDVKASPLPHDALAGHRLGERRENSLAERRPAAAARQGRQAAHLAPDAAPRRAPRHHLPVVSRTRSQTEEHRAGMREVCQRLETVPRTDPAKGTLRFYADAARYVVDPVPYAVAKYRSADYAGRVSGTAADRAASMRSSAISCRRS